MQRKIYEKVWKRGANVSIWHYYAREMKKKNEIQTNNLNESVISAVPP